MSLPVLWYYPHNDVWCEFLEFTDGYWMVGTSAGFIEGPMLNSSDYVEGALSIQANCAPVSYYKTNQMNIFFHTSRIKDFSVADFFEFYCKMTKIGGDSGFDNFKIRLWSRDEVGRFFFAEKGIPIDQSYLVWRKITVDIGPEHEAEWMIQPSFDWSRIIRIDFEFGQNAGGSIQSMLLDGVRYGGYLERAYISVKSMPYSGVIAGLDSLASGPTPITFTLEPPSPVTVTVSAEHPEYPQFKFDHWHDGSTSRSIYVSSSEPDFYEVIAYYIEEPSNGPTPPPTPTKWYPGYYIQLLLEMLQSLKR